MVAPVLSSVLLPESIQRRIERARDNAAQRLIDEQKRQQTLADLRWSSLLSAISAALGDVADSAPPPKRPTEWSAAHQVYWYRLTLLNMLPIVLTLHRVEEDWRVHLIEVVVKEGIHPGTKLLTTIYAPRVECLDDALLTAWMRRDEYLMDSDYWPF